MRNIITAIAMLTATVAVAEPQSIIEYNQYSISQDLPDNSCLFTIKNSGLSATFISRLDVDTLTVVNSLQLSNTSWKMEPGKALLVELVLDTPGLPTSHVVVMKSVSNTMLESVEYALNAADVFTPGGIYGRLNTVNLRLNFPSRERWQLESSDAFIPMRPFEDCQNRLLAAAASNSPFAKKEDDDAEATTAISLGAQINAVTTEQMGHWNLETGKPMALNKRAGVGTVEDTVE